MTAAAKRAYENIVGDWQADVDAATERRTVEIIDAEFAGLIAACEALKKVTHLIDNPTAQDLAWNVVFELSKVKGE